MSSTPEEHTQPEQSDNQNSVSQKVKPDGNGRRIKDVEDPLEQYTYAIVKQYSSEELNEDEKELIKNFEDIMKWNEIEDIKKYFLEYLYIYLCYKTNLSERSRIIWSEIDKYKQMHYENLKPFADFLLWATTKFGERKFFPSDPDEVNKDITISVQNDKIKELMLKLNNEKKFKNRPTEENLRDLITDCRFKNDKINYSKLAKKLGKTHPTVKNWCRDYGIT